MKTCAPAFFFSLLLACPAFGSGTVDWPLAATPPGANSCVIPAPRLEWFTHFQTNVDQSHAMPAIDLIFEGDSITDNWMRPGLNVWKANYASRNAFDFGIGGDRTENVLWRLQQGQLAKLHPKLVVLLIGTNNINSPVEQIAAGVQAIVAEYQKECPDAVILLQGVFPRGEKPTDPYRAKIKSLNSLLAPMADGKKVIYLDFGNKFLQPDGTLSKDIMPDFLHPSEKGYQIWADAINPIVNQYVPAPAK